MAKALVTRGSRILRSGLYHRCKQSLIYTGVRGFASPTESGQDEFKFETLTGDYEGKIHWRISCLENHLLLPPCPMNKFVIKNILKNHST